MTHLLFNEYACYLYKRWICLIVYRAKTQKKFTKVSSGVGVKITSSTQVTVALASSTRCR